MSDCEVPVLRRPGKRPVGLTGWEIDEGGILRGSRPDGRLLILSPAVEWSLDVPEGWCP